MQTVTLLLTIVVSTLVAVCFHLRRQYTYWQRRGVPYIEPEFPFGNVRNVGRTVHHSFRFKEFYDKMKGLGPLCGVYAFNRPLAVVLDIALAKRIMITDFQYFTDRGLYTNEKHDPLWENLFFMEGAKWKHLRSKLTPTFTSGKMKFMYPTVIEVGNRFKDTLIDLVRGEVELEMKDLLARYTTDVIGTCAFGIECNSLKDPQSEFREMGRRMFEEPRHGTVAMFFMSNYKELARFFGVKQTRDDVEQFFTAVVRETIEYREKNNVRCNDFMDLLIKLKNDEVNGLGGLTIEEITAQVFIFFAAGFETSSTTMAYCFYELALNSDIQRRARQEVKEVIKRHGGELTYEAMMNMHYLDQIIHETLRKYPPLSNITRGTQRDYLVPDTNFVIEKGTQVFIPAYAIQHDPEFYPDPEKFDPDRFASDEVAKRDSLHWLPFGEGPRNCIGLRFGMMKTRIGIIALLNNFDFLPSSRTKVPIEIASKGYIMAPDGGMWLKLKKLEEST